MIIEKALDFWDKRSTTRGLSPEKLEEQVVHDVYFSLKANTWYAQILPFKLLGIEGKVKKALSAYKFDLITKGGYADKLHLFSPNERQIIDDGLVPIFKKVLGKTSPISPACLGRLEKIKKVWQKATRFFLRKTDIELKAERWEHKVEKYHHKEKYLVASYALHVLSAANPQNTTDINRLKEIGKKKIQKYAEQLSKYPPLYEALKELLSKPENPSWSEVRNLVVRKAIPYHATAWLDRVTRPIRNFISSSIDFLSPFNGEATANFH